MTSSNAPFSSRSGTRGKNKLAPTERPPGPGRIKARYLVMHHPPATPSSCRNPAVGPIIACNSVSAPFYGQSFDGYQDEFIPGLNNALHTANSKEKPMVLQADLADPAQVLPPNWRRCPRRDRAAHRRDAASRSVEHLRPASRQPGGTTRQRGAAWSRPFEYGQRRGQREGLIQIHLREPVRPIRSACKFSKRCSQAMMGAIEREVLYVTMLQNAASGDLSPPPTRKMESIQRHIVIYLVGILDLPHSTREQYRFLQYCFQKGKPVSF